MENVSQKLSNDPIFLINCFFYTNDHVYFEALLNKYIKMIISVKSKYYIHMFDDDEYMQEARIVLYEVIQIYNPNDSNLTFGNFFKKRYQQRLFDCKRYLSAFKRDNSKIDYSVDALSINENIANYSYENMSKKNYPRTKN